MLIVDDSKHPLSVAELKKCHQSINYIHTDFNIGVSAARNIAIENVKTDYVCLFDDDFFVTKTTNLDSMMNNISKNGLDFVAFKFLDFGLFERRFEGQYRQDAGVVVRDIGKYNVENELPLYDFVLNCFIARTASVKKIMWDPNIKIGYEHDDFFIRAKKNHKMLITVEKKNTIYHFPVRLKGYKKLRMQNIELFKNYFFKKHNITSVVTESYAVTLPKRLFISLFVRLDFVLQRVVILHIIEVHKIVNLYRSK